VAIELSQLIQRAGQDDPQAADALFALLYDELRRLAERQLRRGGANLTLGTTTLVHEAYLSMAGREEMAFPDRARFFAYAARAMRGLIIDYARHRQARKRGRNFEITLVEDDATLGPAALSPADSSGLEALGEALDQLTGLDAMLAELVDLHFFGGFTFAEIAEIRGVSERTVQRDWRKARLLLHSTLHDPLPENVDQRSESESTDNS
jgi:RNA polymerase sigma factor (TIGR02999 family)